MVLTDECRHIGFHFQRGDASVDTGGPVDKRIETISEHSRHYAKQGFKIDNQIVIV